MCNACWYVTAINPPLKLRDWSFGEGMDESWQEERKKKGRNQGHLKSGEEQTLVQAKRDIRGRMFETRAVVWLQESIRYKTLNGGRGTRARDRWRTRRVVWVRFASSMGTQRVSSSLHSKSARETERGPKLLASNKWNKQPE